MYAGPHATADEFLANLGMAAKALRDTLPRVLAFISGKSLKQL